MLDPKELDLQQVRQGMDSMRGFAKEARLFYTRRHYCVQFLWRNFGSAKKQAISTVLVEGSTFYNDFDKTQKYFANLLAVDRTQSDVNKELGRGWNVSYTKTSKGRESGAKKSTYNGPIEARDYPPKIWFSMSKKQQETVRKLRSAKKQNKNG